MDQHLAHIHHLQSLLGDKLLRRQKPDWRALPNLFSGKREGI